MFSGEFYSIPRAADPLDPIPRLFLFHLVVSADCEVNLRILAYVLI